MVSGGGDGHRWGVCDSFRLPTGWAAPATPPDTLSRPAAPITWQNSRRFIRFLATRHSPSCVLARRSSGLGRLAEARRLPVPTAAQLLCHHADVEVRPRAQRPA